MKYKTSSTITQTCDSNSITVYEGKKVTIITVFSDIDIAMIEDENGKIFDVKNSQIRKIAA